MTEERLKQIEQNARDYGFCEVSPEEDFELIAEVRRLRQALRDYGRHDDARCEHFKRCVCGFDAVMEGE